MFFYNLFVLIIIINYSINKNGYEEMQTFNFVTGCFFNGISIIFPQLNLIKIGIGTHYLQKYIIVVTCKQYDFDF